jgi:hypothetical protein
MSAASLCDIALAVATQGLPVFPCGANKRPAISTEDSGQGFHDATTDPDAIRALFAKAPHAKLVGVPTGPRSGFDVLDIDPRHRGDVWERENLHRLPETQIHQTGGSGRHWLFGHAHGVGRNSAGRIAPGVDVRGEGGYVIWWPAHGRHVASDAPMAHWPNWLLQPGLVLPPLRPPSVTPCHAPVSGDRILQFVRRALDRLRAAPDGSVHFTLRNSALLLGGVLHHGAFTSDEAVGWLLDAVPSAIRDWRNEEATARWGLQHGQALPIELRPQGTGSADAPHERLWRDAQPLPGTVGAVYLEALGLGHLIDCPELRFLGDCPHPKGGRLPALVAAVRALDGKLVAVHRTYLRSDGSGLAETDTPRAALGSVMGGAVKLTSSEDVVAAGELVIAEDIEEAASLGVLLNRPAWAVGTVQNLAGRNGIVLPPAVRCVVIAHGADERAARFAWFRFKREARAVRIATPSAGAGSYVEILKNKTVGRDAA